MPEVLCWSENRSQDASHFIRRRRGLPNFCLSPSQPWGKLSLPIGSRACWWRVLRNWCTSLNSKSINSPGQDTGRKGTLFHSNFSLSFLPCESWGMVSCQGLWLSGSAQVLRDTSSAGGVCAGKRALVREVGGLSLQSVWKSCAQWCLLQEWAAWLLWEWEALALSPHPKRHWRRALSAWSWQCQVGKVQGSRWGRLSVLSGFIHPSVISLVQTLVSPSGYIWRAGLGQLSVELLACTCVMWGCSLLFALDLSTLVSCLSSLTWKIVTPLFVVTTIIFHRITFTLLSGWNWSAKRFFGTSDGKRKAWLAQHSIGGTFFSPPWVYESLYIYRGNRTRIWLMQLAWLFHMKFYGWERISGHFQLELHVPNQGWGFGSC